MLNWAGFTDKSGTLLIAGALGGVVRWLTLRDHWTDGLISIAVGAICSLFLSPLALPLLVPALGSFQIPADSVSGLSGFLIGIMGISLSGLIIDLLKFRLKAIVKKPKE